MKDYEKEAVEAIAHAISEKVRLIEYYDSTELDNADECAMAAIAADPLRRKLGPDAIKAIMEGKAGWQPIDAVPDDVDVILAYSPDDDIEGKPIITQATYSYKADPPGWFEVSDGNRLWSVTHWMHLPPPPAEQPEGGQP